MFMIKTKLLLQACGLICIISACQTNPAPDLLETQSSENDLPEDPTIEQLELEDHPIFKDILTKLARKTQVNPLLPSYLPEYPQGPSLYAILANVEQTKYQILLGYTPDCEGQNFCRLGKIEAEIVDASLSLEGEQTVTLNNGIEAYFINAICDNSCTDSTLSWIQDSVKHTIGIKAGKMETLVKIANSM